MKSNFGRGTFFTRYQIGERQGEREIKIWIMRERERESEKERVRKRE